MKYNIALTLLVTLGAIALGGSYLKTSRDRQVALALRASVSALSLQQLSVGRRECDWPGEHAPHSAAYCSEIARALDTMSLQAVDMDAWERAKHQMIVPAAIPLARLRLEKVAVVPPPAPKPVSPFVPPPILY